MDLAAPMRRRISFETARVRRLQFALATCAQAQGAERVRFFVALAKAPVAGALTCAKISTRKPEGLEARAFCWSGKAWARLREPGKHKPDKQWNLGAKRGRAGSSFCVSPTSMPLAQSRPPGLSGRPAGPLRLPIASIKRAEEIGTGLSCSANAGWCTEAAGRGNCWRGCWCCQTSGSRRLQSSR